VAASESLWPLLQQKKIDAQVRDHYLLKIMENDPEMLEEYDFRGGVRSKYAKSDSQPEHFADWAIRRSEKPTWLVPAE
jgi:hypothetical protein